MIRDWFWWFLSKTLLVVLLSAVNSDSLTRQSLSLWLASGCRYSLWSIESDAMIDLSLTWLICQINVQLGRHGLWQKFLITVAFLYIPESTIFQLTRPSYNQLTWSITGIVTTSGTVQAQWTWLSGTAVWTWVLCIWIIFFVSSEFAVVVMFMCKTDF